ncbi:MAG: hypothetical protein ACK463_40115, partial [Bradyrhizobium sp.]
SSSVARNAQGELVLRSTDDLNKLRAEFPDLWFAVRDRDGHTLTEGDVPPDFARIGNALDHISQARLGYQMLEDSPGKPAARLKRVNTDAGNVQILTATQGRMTGTKALLVMAVTCLASTLPGLLLMACATFIATPMVVRRAFAGLETAADEARRIDFRQRVVDGGYQRRDLERQVVGRQPAAALTEVDPAGFVSRGLKAGKGAPHHHRRCDE